MWYYTTLKSIYNCIVGTYAIHTPQFLYHFVANEWCGHPFMYQ